jgi:hypothetical protein
MTNIYDDSDIDDKSAYLAWSVDITELMAKHNITEARAIIWDMQDWVPEFDLSQYCWRRGLSWSTQLEIEKLLESIGVLQDG